MIYWLHEKETGYEDWQVEKAIAEERLTEKDYTLIEDEVWKEMWDKMSTGEFLIKNNPVDNTPQLIPYVVPREDLLYDELRSTENRLRELDYIGVKIATGRATQEEYAKEIAEMNTLANRINEIKAELSSLSTNYSRSL